MIAIRSMGRIRWLLLTLVLGAGLALLTAGCSSNSGGSSGTTSSGGSSAAPEPNAAGDIPDNQAYVDYTPPSKAYVIKVPEGWARAESGGAVVFTGKLNSIRVETATASAAPSVATGQPDLDKIKTTAQGFAAGKVSMVSRKSGQALLITYRADGAADPVTGKVVNDDIERYQFFNAGKLVTVTLAAPHGADNVDPWRTVTDGFRWGS
jgi:hypothetical protein